MKKINILLIVILTITINSCANNSNLSKENNNSIILGNNSLDNYIKEDSLDSADEAYITLKEEDINQNILKESAKKLALAHMQKQEYILANFYIQEAISNDESDDSLKLLLVKNQYLAALHNSTDMSYLKKALRALEENINLVVNNDDRVKADKMLKEVRELMAKKNAKIANYYKLKRKDKAYELYNDKVKLLNQNNVIESINNIFTDNNADSVLDNVQAETKKENIQ